MDALIEFLSTFWLNFHGGFLPSLGYWNYAILAFFVMIEGLVTILLGAAAASAGILKLPLVIIAACCGNLIADIVWYRLGYFGKLEWISHLTKKFIRQSRLVDNLKDGLQHHGWKILLLAKFTGGLSIPTLITTGLVRVPMRKWFPIVFIGETIKTSILALIGFYTTTAIRQIAEDIRYAMILVSVSVLIGLILWLRVIIKKKQTYKDYFDVQENSEK